jgi:hypothetical protein
MDVLLMVNPQKDAPIGSHLVHIRLVELIKHYGHKYYQRLLPYLLPD